MHDRNIHLERDELEAALQALDQAIALDPDYPAALLTGRWVYRSGQGQRAANDLTKTLAIAGDDPDLLLNRALAYRSAGRPDLAVADLDRALELPGADGTELRRQRDACLNSLRPAQASGSR